MLRANNIIGPIFYEETLDAEWYIDEILNPLYSNMEPAEARLGYIIQDGASPRTAKETIWELCSVSGELYADDRIISKGVWSPRSPDLNPC
jgi:hypothetical protein